MDSDSEDSDEDGAPVLHRKDTHRRCKYDRTRRATEKDDMSILKTAQRVAERATCAKENILEARRAKRRKVGGAAAGDDDDDAGETASGETEDDDDTPQPWMSDAQLLGPGLRE